MPYSPTTWADTPATTSPISAANLNKIETELARLKVNADLDPAAAIAYSKLALALSIVNGDVSASAAIAYSKLNLATSIVNADIATAAAIAASKLAAYPSDGTKFLAGDGTWKAAAGTTQRKTTPKTVNTTVAATDLLNGEITIAAGVMGTTGLARLTTEGDWVQNSGGVAAGPRIQLVLGAATLLDTNAPSNVSASATRTYFNITAEIQNLTATTQSCRIRVSYGSPAGTVTTAVFFTTGEGIINSTSNGSVAEGVGTAGVDTTLAQALKLNVINGSASATYETKLFGALVEII